MLTNFKDDEMFNKTRNHITQTLIHKLGHTGTPEFRSFIKLFMDRFPLSYLGRLDIDEVSGYIESVWENFNQYDRSAPFVEVKVGKISVHRTERVFITMLNVDRPYLIESVLSFFQKWDLKPQLLIHPVLAVKRNEDGSVHGIVETVNQSQNNGSIAFESVIFVQAKNRFTDKTRVIFQQELSELLEKICLTVDAIPQILSDMHKIQEQLPNAVVGKCTAEDVIEVRAFLGWLTERYFVPIGARYFDVKAQVSKNDFYCLEENLDSRQGLFVQDEFAQLDDMVPSLTRAKILIDHESHDPGMHQLLTVIKTNQRSPIHRPSRVDSIEIMDWGTSGKINGVYQVVGVFKKEIFSTQAFEVPYLRKKVTAVFDQFNLNPNWYDGKSLLSIIDSIPRDEMFYHTTEQLFNICDTVLELRDHAGLSVFLRPDDYGRYLTVMVFMTRERYSFALKEKLGQLIAQYFGANIGSSVAQIGDLPFARVIYVVEFTEPTRINVNADELQSILAEASLGWYEHLERFIDQQTAIDNATDFLAPYRKSFSSSYQEAFLPSEVYEDILCIEQLSADSPIDINIYKHKNRGIRVKIYFKGAALSLSALLPLLNNFGLKVLSETSHTINRAKDEYHIHDFDVEIEDSVNWRENEILIRPALQMVWAGSIENDGFNQLILRAGLTVKQTNMLRTYVKYLLQIKMPYSQSYVEQTLASYPEICVGFAELFEQRFNPDQSDKSTITSIESKISEQLQDVSRLDHDRILRRMLNAIQSTVRTNYYQLTADHLDKDYLSMKFESARLSEMPQPRPMFEIFVYSSTMEAIHLRGGKVARGGLRWSDRFEDYRSEVLGLMKAQMVKNSVIVPLGSKGGFVVKRHNDFSDRAQLMDEVVRCYQTMIQGLLDITDNLIEGTIVAPERVIRYDDDDPYLVVAADKGTSTFSDVANKISMDYGFWLDDAFASGGSAGYDHKKMAITSQGAWESVKRHFREMDIDVQAQRFTAVGVGDMSGDVFGNGMLRSEKIRLLAAFDHRHIFIDPNPDCEVSYGERKRLFNLPRSSWDDYDKNLISSGGGVYSRTLKSIKLSDDAVNILGLTQADNSPDEIIRAILQAEVDLLWFGGIGTYVKSHNESNSDVGDNVNAALRVDGRELRAKVIGEGANLGMTQLSRIEFALKGGAINTDAIDNSAGVDCSDHEVNIKILFSSLSQKIERETRNRMLVDMTDNVAKLVLTDNYEQTQILSVMQRSGKDGLNNYQNLIKILENEVHLNRSIEYLPDDEIFERRRSKGQGMTRPELSVLLAYAKISLCDKIMSSNLVELPFYHDYLVGYFPKMMQEKFKDDILEHPLKREIIATVAANMLVNRVGPAFVYEMSLVTNCSVPEVVHAFFVAIRAFELHKWWDEIDQLDPLMCADLQNEAYDRIAFALRTAVMRILGADYSNASKINGIMSQLPTLIAGVDQQKLAQDIVEYIGRNIPQSTAEKLSLIEFLGSIMDMASLHLHDCTMNDAGKIYFAVRSLFGLDWLQDQAIAFDAEGDWQESAQLGLIDDVGQTIMALTQQVINSGYGHNFDAWIETQQSQIRQAKSILSPLRASSRPDIGMLAFAVRQIQRMPQLKKALHSL